VRRTLGIGDGLADGLAQQLVRLAQSSDYELIGEPLRSDAPHGQSPCGR
jgi:hypothetical protein